MILQKSLTYDNATQANFQNWAQGISTAMATLGLTKTTDTGQVDWTTNPALPTYRGGWDFNAPYYEIWQFADAFSSVCPVLIKLQYGSELGYGGNSPAFQISVGNTTDGAGNLTGIVFGPYATYLAQGSGNTNNGQTFTCNFSGAPGRIAMMLWENSPLASSGGYPATFLGVERSVDANGNYTGSYCTVLAAIGSTSGPFNVSAPQIYQATIMATGTGGMSIQNGMWVTVAVNTGNTGFGGSSAFLPVFPFIGKLDNPCTVAGVVKNGDQTEAGVFSINLYGNSRSYLYSSVPNFANVGNASNNGIAMRWD